MPWTPDLQLLTSAGGGGKGPLAATTLLGDVHRSVSSAQHVPDGRVGRCHRDADADADDMRSAGHDEGLIECSQNIISGTLHLVDRRNVRQKDDELVAA